MTEPSAGNATEMNEEMLDKCINFLRSIGIEIREEKITENCFLPGLSISGSTITIDRSTLKYPGDILHEAGHIAVVTSAEREGLTGASIAERKDREAEEMMAIAWSYAACVHLDLDPYVVFHDHGYKGGGNYIADNFKNKQYFGLPMLQWKRMAVDEKNAAAMNIEPYPFMIKWMLD